MVGGLLQRVQLPSVDGSESGHDVSLEQGFLIMKVKRFGAD